MKKTLFITLFTAVFFLSGCISLEEVETVDADTIELYEVNDVFQARYNAQNEYLATHAYDEVGKKDFAETELKFLFTQELLNEGVACRDYDYRFDEFKDYFPWYKSMLNLKGDISVTDKAYEIDEFCYSNLSGAALYSYKTDLAPSGVEYVLYGYLGNGLTQKYHALPYDQKVDCKVADWNDDDVKWSCKYEKDGEKISDKYSYDFFFETATLLEACKGEGENQVCEQAIQ